MERQRGKTDRREKPMRGAERRDSREIKERREKAQKGKTESTIYGQRRDRQMRGTQGGSR